MRYQNPSVHGWLTLAVIAVAGAFAFVTVKVCRDTESELPLAGYRHTRREIASWYKASGMVCATRLYRKGAQIRVSHGGTSIVVTVASAGPAWRWFIRGRKIDLSREAFSMLAAPRVGLIEVDTEFLR